MDEQSVSKAEDAEIGAAGTSDRSNGDALASKGVHSPGSSSSHRKDKNDDGDDDRKADDNDNNNEREVSVDADPSKEEISCEVKVEGIDKNTLIWLESKQNARFFLEEFGVCLVRMGVLSDSESKPEVQLDDNSLRQGTGFVDGEHKSESHTDPLYFKISMETSERFDRDDAHWFVNQAANFLKLIASWGVFVKCFWYEGPIPQGADGMLPVSSVVKKIKGHDGKNLERIQDRTGVIIGVVINNKAVSISQHSNSELPQKLIGVRIRCVRKRGVCEASKKIEQLLALAGSYFQREASLEAKEKNVGHSESSKRPSPIPSTSSGVKRSFTSKTGQSSSTTPPLQLYSAFEKRELKTADGYMRMDNVESYAPRPSLYRKPQFEDIRDEVVNEPPLPPPPPPPPPPQQVEGRTSPHLLYAYNLPGRMPVRVLKSIFHKTLVEKLALPYSYEPVVHAMLSPDQSYVTLQLATEGLVDACLRLYAEDKTVFDGLKVGFPRVPLSKLDETGIQDGFGLRKKEDTRYGNDERFYLNDNFSQPRRNYDNRYPEQEQRHKKPMQWVDNDAEDEPNTLYLTELGPHSSAQAIRELFEDILRHYIGPPLVSSSGRKLVLDVRYVTTKGCAFVDMATPELVDFMLDLHYQRPDMFDYMKMEIGNKYINDTREENYRSDWMLPEARGGRYPPNNKPRGSHEMDTVSSYSYADRAAKRMKHTDYKEDNRDNFYRSDGSRKQHKSDPEKTVFAYNFPGNATGKMICQIFERVLRVDGKALLHEEIVTEVRIPSKFYCFVVFATEELTRLALQLFARDRDIFDKIQLRPHMDSHMEERFWDCFQDSNHDFRGTARPFEFGHKKPGFDDHVGSLSSSSKYQTWKGPNLNSERYAATPSLT